MLKNTVVCEPVACLHLLTHLYSALKHEVRFSCNVPEKDICGRLQAAESQIKVFADGFIEALLWQSVQMNRCFHEDRQPIYTVARLSPIKYCLIYFYLFIFFKQNKANQESLTHLVFEFDEGPQLLHT